MGDFNLRCGPEKDDFNLWSACIYTQRDKDRAWKETSAKCVRVPVDNTAWPCGVCVCVCVCVYMCASTPHPSLSNNCIIAIANSLPAGGTRSPLTKLLDSTQGVHVPSVHVHVPSMELRTQPSGPGRLQPLCSPVITVITLTENKQAHSWDACHCLVSVSLR